MPTNIEFHGELSGEFPVKGGAFAFGERSLSSQLRFISYFRGYFGKSISDAARKYCIPPELLFSNIIAELSDFDWKDMTDMGNSVGIGQVSHSMIDLYSLTVRELIKVSLPQFRSTYMADPHNSIDLTAQRIDKQIIELCYAANGGRAGAHPAIPAFSNIPAMSASVQSFRESFEDINLSSFQSKECRRNESYSCRFDGNSAACHRPSRCNDPSATYSLLSFSGNAADAARYTSANLARVLTTMNDVVRLSPENTPLYGRSSIGGKSHSMMIYKFIMLNGMGPFK